MEGRAERARGSEPEYVPAHPLLEGVYTFPWYARSLKAWVFLTLGGLGMGVMALALIALWPF